MALTNKLSAIGDAIREKTGKSEKLTLEQMPVEITSITTGGGGEVEPLVLTGDCKYACAGAMAIKYIDLYGDTVSTKDITDAAYMFYQNRNKTIPFEINISGSASSCQFSNMFHDCINLISLPKLNANNRTPSNFDNMFLGCDALREIPDDYFDSCNFDPIKNSTSAYTYNAGGMVSGCTSLRKAPSTIFKNMNPIGYVSYSYFYRGFSACHNLDELIDTPIPYTAATWTSNAFYDFVSLCGRLKRFTFETNEDGTPMVVKWKSQTIDLLTHVGYAASKHYILNYNSGITADKEVVDDATYQALKDDPDWFTTNIAYSRYNHDSAVATINSLPDTSAYLATAGGTNTIKFKGDAGSLTDGGAINTLTEEEIAVAAAKGWTVTLS